MLSKLWATYEMNFWERKVHGASKCKAPCKRTQHCYGDVTYCVRLHTLLHVVGCCCVLLRKV